MVTIGYSIRASFRCTVAQQSALDRVPDDFFFGDVRKKNRPETRKIFTGCSLFGYPIAIDRAWSNDKSGLGREPWMFARVKKRERRDKIFAETKHTILAHKKSNFQISLSETQKEQFSMGNFQIFGRGNKTNFCVCGRV